MFVWVDLMEFRTDEYKQAILMGWHLFFKLFLMRANVLILMLLFSVSRLLADTTIQFSTVQVGYFHHQLKGSFTQGLKIHSSGFLIGSDSLITLNDENVKNILCDITGNSNQFSCLAGPGLFKKQSLYYVRSYVISKGKVLYSPTHRLSTKSQEYEIGERVLGGRLLYVFSPIDSMYEKGKTHGIIVADTVFNSMPVSHNQALIICDNIQLSGYNDWFLPKVTEMGILWFHSNLFDLKGKSKFWTSTKYSGDKAVIFSFGKVPKMEEIDLNAKNYYLPMRYF